MRRSSGLDKPPVAVDRESRQVSELVKVESIEEANKLLQEGYIFLAAYYNQKLSREEYILGRLEKENKLTRPIGFRP